VNQAWVVAVDMGYGHQRAAHPFRDIAFERIFTANTDDQVAPEERRLWEKLQGFYEGVSRAHNIPLVGPWLWRAYDRLQAIHPHYPFRDLSKPSIGSSRLQRLIRRGFGRGVTEHTRKREDLPFLTTFYAVALAADHAGRRDVFCVVTDSDINRVWVAEDPRKSGVHYLAPTALSRVRLLQYGVPEERIFVTGFPLPEDLVETAGPDLARRLAVLDAGGVFRARYRSILKPELWTVPNTAGRPLSITFAVGGAGAQAKTAGDILESLAGPLRDGRMRLNLVAGVRQEVRDYFLEIIRRRGLEVEIGRSVHVLFTATKDDYFAQFNALMRETDVLWTKPSELSFFAGLGLPIVMSPALGAHEERNQAALMQAGAGHRQENPRAAAEWLSDWARNGMLAVSAFNGFLHAPRHGTENIKRVLFASDRSRVELVAALPELGGARPGPS
jgi:plasmid stabilization system protein ParE